MLSLIITGPTSEPITLAETKLYLKVEYSEDDDLINSLITASRQYVEAATGLQIKPATWDLFLDTWPDVIYLPKPPVSSITYVKYYDGTGALQTLDTADYQVDLVSKPARISPAYGETWPILYGEYNDVQIRFVSGFSTVPSTLQTACKLLVAHYYENRIAVGNFGNEVPLAVNALLSAEGYGDYYSASLA